MPADRFEWWSSKNKKTRRLISVGILILCFALILFSPRSTVFLPPMPEPQLRVIEGTVKQRGTFYESLIASNIPGPWVDFIIAKLSAHIDFRKIKGGVYRFATDTAGDFQKFIFEKSPTEVYSLKKGPEGYVAIKEAVHLQKYLLKVEGEIRSSLFEAVNEAGEDDLLAVSIADILAWEIDFYKDVREGDRFKAVVEKIYKGDQFIQYGPIHALEYASGERVTRGVHYRKKYYDENGNSLRKAFLKSPLQFNRVSSGFSRARKHPILGGTFPHLGVDYAAPSGTPVWAVADGTVLSAGQNGGFGKQVILRHANGYKTHYSHLSRYGPGIKKGVRVEQKHVVGYVGSTGLSTGPHLDYRISQNGRFQNPLKKIFPPGSPIEKREMKEFQRIREEVLTWMNQSVVRSIRLGDITSDTLHKDGRSSLPR